MYHTVNMVNSMSHAICNLNLLAFATILSYNPVLPPRIGQNVMECNKRRIATLNDTFTLILNSHTLNIYKRWI